MRRAGSPDRGRGSPKEREPTVFCTENRDIVPSPWAKCAEPLGCPFNKGEDQQIHLVGASAGGKMLGTGVPLSSGPRVPLIQPSPGHPAGVHMALRSPQAWAGLGAGPLGPPGPHLSSVRARGPLTEPLTDRGTLPGPDSADFVPHSRQEGTGRGSLCVSSTCWEWGSRAQVCLPLGRPACPGSGYCVCRHLPPAWPASCIIQTPWRGPSERVPTRAD